MEKLINWHFWCNWIQAVKASHNKLNIQPSRFRVKFPKLQLTPADHPHACKNMPLLSCSLIFYGYNFQVMDLTNPQILHQTKQIGAMTNAIVIAHKEREGIKKKNPNDLKFIRKYRRRMARWDLNAEQNFRMGNVHHLPGICLGTAVCKSPLVSTTRKEVLLGDLGQM